ncbi:hypothetical protein ABAC460_22935 [Asticcacaulis sp. AC460]|uniref:DUF3307 domain-containing protein n=1 Tax=Asticcacaulis sp. AC460 TaxID=1282360 RepID=UPI0003C3EE18|nr:DUF3307 domain-containing protein [Asticcacaulis sp. AC460]ESQ86572.1 hypothetical protein ABAC460_22935 [Asticcacaulis sp. AC460]
MATFLALFAAHMLSDFVLQTEWMVANKRRPAILCLHILITVAVAVVIMGGAPLPLLAALAVSHFSMDALKTYVLKDNISSFLGDQIFHIAILAILSWIYPDTFEQWWWPQWLSEAGLKLYLTGLTLLSGIVANLLFGAFLIRKLTAQFTTQIRSNIKGLEKGGFYIGLLERGLVMLFILINQPTGVGFLITAKSILRFGDVKNAAQRKSTEYIIIGTFMSFGWSLLISVITQSLMKYW